MEDRHLTAAALAPMLAGLADAIPRYRALADRLRLLAIDGRLAPGVRLPAERDLATRMGLSRTTVTRAYATLRDDGFLVSRRGSGSVITIPGPRPGPASWQVAAGAAPGPTTAAAHAAVHEGEPVGPDDTARAPHDVGRIDLAKAAMPAASQLAAAAAAAAQDLPRYLTGHDYDPVGLPALRAALANRYTDLGLPTSPDEILVTLGAQHAIGLVARTHLRRGDRAVVEMPTYPHALDAIIDVGARPVPVPVTAGDGWDHAELLRAVASGPRLAHLMPDLHNPTGASMHDDLREAVCRAAARSGTTLVVDETTAQLDIDRPDPWRPFARHAAPGTQVVTIGSVGKTVWGGLRLGWVRADPGTLARLVAARHVHDLGTPILEQLVLLHVLPHLDEIVTMRREQLRATRDHLEALLARRLPGWRVPHVHGGLAVWVELDEPRSSQLAVVAGERGLQISAGPRFGTDGEFERHLRIPITNAVGITTRAVDILADAWATITATPARAYSHASWPV